MASITKRGNSYRIRVSNGRDSSGNQIIESTTFTPDPAKTAKQNEKALNEFVLDFERKVKSGRYLDGENLRFKDFAAKWLKEYAEPRLAYSTYENYQMNLEKRIIPAMGHLKMSGITPLHIQSFYRDLAAAPRNDKKAGSLSAGSIRKIHAILSSMFHTAVIWQIIEQNPCDRIEPPKDQRINTGVKCFTLEQAETFLKVLDGSIKVNYPERHRKNADGEIYPVAAYETQQDIPLQIKVFFYMALFGGFRRGELLALTWKDIDFENGQANIYKSLTLKDHQMVIKTPKNKTSVRSVALPDVVMDLIRQLKLQQRTYALSIGSQWVGKWGQEYDDNFLFTQWNGKVMYLDTPYQWFKKIIARYNASADPANALPDIPLHGLRHTSATLLISQNVDVKTVSGRLGHSQTSTTMNIYAHSLRKSDEAAAETLQKALFK